MNQPNSQVMTDLPVSEHLAELRRRLIIIISTLTLGTILAYYFVPGISQILIRPIAKFNLTLAFFTVTGAFVTRVKLALIAATIVLSPLIFYQIAAFITPGLRTAEKRLIMSILLFLSLAFAAGVVFGYYLVIPLTLHFLITFGKSYLTPVLSGERYLSFIAVLEIINGAVFTVPVIIIYLGKMGILQARLLKKGRKYLLGFLLIVEGMMGSLNDFFSLVLLALPLIILYEISLWSVYWLEKKRAKSGE